MNKPARPQPVQTFSTEQLAAALATMLQPQAPDADPAPEDPPSETEPVAYDVESFCKAHHISRSKFFMLRAEDRAREEELGRPLLPAERKAPRCKGIGAKLIISREAAREWRNG